MAEKHYRVVCTGGHVYDVAVWLDGDNWLARMDGETPWSGDDERAAVINACNEHIHIAEVRAPGELTTHEQVAAAVAAEQERCAGVCRSLAKRLPATWGADAAAGCADAIELGEEVGHV